jgi:hypothetical protein
MNKKLFFLAIVLLGACTNSNKPLTDSDKDKIVGEAKVFIGSVLQTCEIPDQEKLKSMYLDSPDFISLVGGISADYEQSLKNVDGYFANVTSQKSTIKSEKYIVLDATTVLYTANSSWETKMKTDSIVVMDPVGLQFLLKKVDNQWKVLSWTEVFK